MVLTKREFHLIIWPSLIFLVVGLVLSPFILRDYPSSEHLLNKENPLILSNDFVICDQNIYYDNLRNLSSYNVDFSKICNKQYQEEIWFRAEGNIIKSSIINLDSFFSGSETIITTNKGDYILTKLSESREGAYIRIEDRTQGKEFFWEK